MVLVSIGLGGVAAMTAQAADRDNVLNEPGVYGTFAAFRINGEWGTLEQTARIAHLTAMKGVVERHRDKLALNKGKEARHNRRVGNPTLVGTARTLDQLIEALAQ